MSRPRLLRPMAPDLDALGDQLAEAVERDVRRRRARRQIFLNAAASMMLVLPIAIGAATASVGRDEAEVVGPAGASATLSWTPGYDISWRHIPDKPIYTMEYAKCRDGNDCRIAQPEVPFQVDFPPRRT